MRNLTSQVTLRLPGDIKAWIAQQARRNGASQNSEIIRTLRSRMDEDALRAVDPTLLPPGYSAEGR